MGPVFFTGLVCLLAAAGGYARPVAAAPDSAPQAQPVASGDGGDRSSGDAVLRAPFERFRLPNGLTVVLHRDPEAPRVVVNLWYHTGSGDEQPGRTGFAHLFEHLMFEGSAHVPEGAFDRWLEEAGGDNNGSTTSDRTNYWIEVPPSALSLALFLESDRMGHLLPTMSEARVDGQRDVVKNERRQSYENRPYGAADLAMPGWLWPAGHPYSWPVIGSMADLSAATFRDVVRFYRRHYQPAQASLVVAGPIDLAATRQLVTHYFSDVPGRPLATAAGGAARVPSPAVAPLAEERRYVLEDDVQLPKLMIYWRSVPAFAPDDAALDVTAALLGEGKRARLYRRLVHERQLAQAVGVAQDSRRLGGAFSIEVIARPGVSLGTLLDAVDEELAALAQHGPEGAELLRVQNRIEADFYDAFERLGGFGGRADRMNAYLFALDAPDSFAADLDRYRRVSGSDVQRVIRAHLPRRRVVASVVPEGASHLAVPGSEAQPVEVSP